ncbi:hypothetical protein ACNF40_00910 [Cuniculiplasma sp. SKW4]|uniref:hypothetical protein n=1 Tax=Cuniculiplasma sp. SKW4 TaxID=3400171 RepID=UPI003FD4DD57
MALNLRKSEEDKRFETRSKIRNYKSEVDRDIKRQQQLLAQSIANVKKAAAIKDRKGMMNAAQNATRIKSAIDYLKSFSLYLDNLETTFEFVYNERRMNKTLTNVQSDLGKRMLTDQQARQIESNIMAINQKTEDLERRLEDQFSSLDESLNEFAKRGGEDAEDIIKSITGESLSSSSQEDSSGQKEVDELIKKILGEGEKGT